MEQLLEQLVKMAQAGDQEAWTELCRRFTPLVKKTVRQEHLFSMREDAEGEAWLALAEAIASYRSELGVPVAGYLAAAVRYRIWNCFKKERRHWQREAAAELLPESGVEDREADLDDEWRQQTIAALLAALPPRQRQLLHLVFWGELSLTQAALQFGITPQAASQLQKRALARLRRHWARMYESERG